jgi:integrase
VIAPVSNPTLRTLIEWHYLPFISGRAAESTLKDYRAALNAWDRFGQPLKPVEDLYGADFNRFAETASNAGKAPSTVDKWLRVFRAGCQFGLQEGLIDRLPVMRPLPVDEQVKWRPSLDELSRLYRACRVAKWPDRAGGPAVWWRAFLVLSYVGALRRSDCINRLRWDQVMPDGIHGRRQKRKRLTFIPMLPCVRKHLDGLEREAGSAFILPAPSGPRQFRETQNAIGQAAGFSWTPHAIKRAGTDGWYDADPSATAAHIISHARLSVTIRSYLDRVKVLKTHAPALPIPEAFGKERVVPKRDDAGEFLKMYRRLSAADREAVRSIAERLVS